MQLHKLACSSLSLLAVSWGCMQFLSLSEQLTRISQCLFLKYSQCYHKASWSWQLELAVGVGDLHTNRWLSTGKIASNRAPIWLKLINPSKFIWSISFIDHSIDHLLLTHKSKIKWSSTSFTFYSPWLGCLQSASFGQCSGSFIDLRHQEDKQ